VLQHKPPGKNRNEGRHTRRLFFYLFANLKNPSAGTSEVEGGTSEVLIRSSEVLINFPEVLIWYSEVLIWASEV